MFVRCRIDRFIHLEPVYSTVIDGPVNMAVDDSLMRRAGRTRDAVFRVYGWSVPTLSLGRNQRARDCYNLDAARDAGIGFVRRDGRRLLPPRSPQELQTTSPGAANGIRVSCLRHGRELQLASAGASIGINGSCKQPPRGLQAATAGAANGLRPGCNRHGRELQMDFARAATGVRRSFNRH
jgi:hypothetical protein